MATILDGWIYHTEPYSTPPSLLSGYYFGLIPPDKRAMLNTPLTTNIIEENVYGVYTPTLETGSQLADQITMKFVPVNGLFLYWMFGKASDADGVRTIEMFDGTARKPRLGTWQKSDNVKYHHYGVCVHSCELEYSDNGTQVTLIGKGLSHGNETGTMVLNYPSGITGSTDDSFCVFSSMTWHETSLNPQRFRSSYQQAIQGYIDVTGRYYQEINEFSPIGSVYTVQFTSSEGESIRGDYLAGTKRDFTWRISKPNTGRYIEITTSGMIASLTLTQIYGEAIVYTAVIKGEAPIGTVVDGIYSGFYQL